MSENLSQTDLEQNQQLQSIRKSLAELDKELGKISKEKTNSPKTKIQSIALFATAFVAIICFLGIEVSRSSQEFSFHFDPKKSLELLTKFALAAGGIKGFEVGMEKYKE